LPGGPALASRYLSIFCGVKAKGNSNAIRALRHKGKGREVSKRRRKEKRVKEKTSPMAITSILALKTIYCH